MIQDVLRAIKDWINPKFESLERSIGNFDVNTSIKSKLTDIGNNLAKNQPSLLRSAQLADNLLAKMSQTEDQPTWIKIPYLTGSLTCEYAGVSEYDNRHYQWICYNPAVEKNSTFYTESISPKIGDKVYWWQDDTNEYIELGEIIEVGHSGILDNISISRITGEPAIDRSLLYITSEGIPALPIFNVTQFGPEYTEYHYFVENETGITSTSNKYVSASLSKVQYIKNRTVAIVKNNTYIIDPSSKSITSNENLENVDAKPLIVDGEEKSLEELAVSAQSGNYLLTDIFPIYGNMSDDNGVLQQVHMLDIFKWEKVEGPLPSKEPGKTIKDCYDKIDLLYDKINEIGLSLNQLLELYERK